jgi:hypothetical protein
MQNKPNLLDAQMNVTSILTKDYENVPRLRTPPKQTQSNPISNRAPYRSAERCSGQVWDFWALEAQRKTESFLLRYDSL